MNSREDMLSSKSSKYLSAFWHLAESKAFVGEREGAIEAGMYAVDTQAGGVSLKLHHRSARPKSTTTDQLTSIGMPN